MEIRSKLPKFFHFLFIVLEGYFVLLVLEHCLLFLAFPHFVEPISSQVTRHGLGNIDYHFNFNYAGNLAGVTLMPDAGPLNVETHDTKAEAINIKELQATISFRNPASDSELRALMRWDLVSALADACYMVVIFDLLRRLARNVVRGESFSERSMYLLQKIGITIIVFSLITTVMGSWANNQRNIYLKKHITVSGMSLALPPADGVILQVAFDANNFVFPFDTRKILIGLLILSLGEVFRQGLSLKKEHELTI